MPFLIPLMTQLSDSRSWTP